ncbi:MAG: fused MFS/spermidine synthase [Chitinophagales bacterium]|nr:fused MFS/spermidine synthase [Chitinophagales bacterium]
MAVKDTLKKWYSFLVERPVANFESEVSPGLKLSYFKGRYVLGVNNIIYSFEDEYTAFKEAFSKLKPKKRGIHDVLILGYGIGSIPAILHKRHQMHCDYVGVELDPAVISIAKEYGYKPPKSHIHLFCVDAMDYVRAAKDQFDLICVDLFVDETVPAQFDTEEFVEHLRRLMAPKGLILFNRLYANTNQRIATDGYFQFVFQKEFPEAYPIDTNGNLVLVFDDRVKKIKGMRKEQTRASSDK